MLLVSCGLIFFNDGLHTCTISVLLRQFPPMPVSSSTAPILSSIKFRISVSISKVYSSTCNYHYYLSSLKCVILASAPIWEAVETQTLSVSPVPFYCLVYLILCQLFLFLYSVALIEISDSDFIIIFIVQNCLRYSWSSVFPYEF